MPTTSQLRDIAKRHLAELGYTLERAPQGHFGGTFYVVSKPGEKPFTLSIRTTRDRWVSFQPKPAHDGTFHALEHADRVLIVSVDSHERPEYAELYWINGNEVRDAFKASFLARKDAGHTFAEDWGMWVGLDRVDEPNPTYVGSGLKEYAYQTATASWNGSVVVKNAPQRPVEAPRAVVAQAAPPAIQALPTALPAPRTAMDIIRAAEAEVAALMGVPAAEVKLKLQLVTQ